MDVDHVLRKEVNMDCVTPSHSTAIPHGESLDIYQLLSRPDARLTKSANSVQPLKSRLWYEPRTPVLAGSRPQLDFLDAQITPTERRSSPRKSRSKLQTPRHDVNNAVIPPAEVFKNVVARKDKPPESSTKHARDRISPGTREVERNEQVVRHM